LIFLFPSIRTFAQAPDWFWAGGLGGVGWIGAYASSAAVSEEGYIYTTGAFTGTIDFDPGPNTYDLNSNGPDAIYISKLDSQGNFVWAKAIGAIDDDYSNGGLEAYIDLDAVGNVYVSSVFHVRVDFDPGPGIYNLSPVSEFFDVFIVKLDSSGNFVWAKSFGGSSNDFVYEIRVDSSRNFLYTTGLFGATADFNPGPGTYNLTNLAAADVFISKLDLDGDFIWAKALGGTYEIEPSSVEIDTAGNPCISGAFWETADFNPGTGTFELTSNGAKDLFITKLDTDGDFVWANNIGGPSWDYASDIKVELTSDNLFVTGYFNETVDFDPGSDVNNLVSAGGGDIFVSKFNAAGSFLSAISMGGEEYDFGYSITIDNTGNGGIYVTGFFRGLSDFDPGPGTYFMTPNGLDDAFIVKLNSSGDFVWAYSAGGSSFDYSNAVVLDPFGYGYITGFVQSESITFGSTTITNNCNSTSFISKFYACNGIVSNAGDVIHGSLRHVIECSPDNSLITFNLPPLSQISLTNGEIVIDKNLTISGTGISDLTISGNNASRIFNLMPGYDFHIENLSLKDAASGSNGGALFVKGNLTLKNALLENNFENGSPKSLTLINPGSLTTIGNVQLKY